MFPVQKAMGYKKTGRSLCFSLLLCMYPNLNQDYDDKYTILKAQSQAFTPLFYELDANGLVHLDVLMRIR